MVKVTDRRSYAMGKGHGGTRSLSKVDRIVRHWSATSDGNTSSFERFWKSTYGWIKGGYHEVILRDGSVELNYNYNENSNGVGGENSHIYNICLVASPDSGFTAAQEATFKERALLAMKQFPNVKSISQIVGHNEFPTHKWNQCPGIDMNKVRKALSAGEAVKAPNAPTAKVTNKTIDQLAREVIKGEHGNGDDRKRSLGKLYDAVQKRVNELKDDNEVTAKVINKGSKVTTPTLFVTSDSTKNVRTSPITGIVDTINNGWRNQVRLKDSKGNYIGFTRLSDIGAKSTTSAAAAPKPTSKKYNLPNAEYWVKSPQFNGSGVRTVQEALSSIYYYPDKGAKNNGVDGYYGPKSADAVKRFQSMYGLKADGIYGAATRKKLDSLVN